MTKKTEAQSSMFKAPERGAPNESYVLIPGIELSVLTMRNIVAVWIGPPSSGSFRDFGACVGAGATRQEAITQAVIALEAAVDVLQGAPPK